MSISSPVSLCNFLETLQILTTLAMSLEARGPLWVAPTRDEFNTKCILAYPLGQPECFLSSRQPINLLAPTKSFIDEPSQLQLTQPQPYGSYSWSMVVSLCCEWAPGPSPAVVPSQ